MGGSIRPASSKIPSKIRAFFQKPASEIRSMVWGFRPMTSWNKEGLLRQSERAVFPHSCSFSLIISREVMQDSPKV
jgi:hypothetical protein